MVLQDLIHRFGPRVKTVKLSSNEDEDCKQIQQVAASPIDCVFDILPPSVETKVVRAAMMSVRRNGRIVLMGGVGMLGGAGLDLPYPWIMRNNITIKGQWMYQPQAVVPMVGLTRAGLLNLHHFKITEFSLDKANEAVSYAAKNGGPFNMTVIKPRLV